MKQTVVLYKSKYGAAKKYAGWIQEALSCDAYQVGEFQWEAITKYDLVILAGGIYAGGISIVKDLKKHLTALADKELILFAAGASPFDQKMLEELKLRNTETLHREIPIFYGRGAFDEEKMTVIDRMLCRMIKKSLSKKEPKDFEPWMKELFEWDGKGCDWTDPKYLEELLAYTKAFESAGKDNR